VWLDVDDTHNPIITPSENEPDYCFEWEDARWKGKEICRNHHSC